MVAECDDVIPRPDEVIPDMIGDLGDLLIIKVKPMTVNVPLGIWLAGERGSTLEVVVGMEGGGIGLFEVSRLCRFILFYNPQTPF